MEISGPFFYLSYTIFNDVLFIQNDCPFSGIMATFTLFIYMQRPFKTWHLTKLTVHFLLAKSCYIQGLLFLLTQYFLFFDYNHFNFENIQQFQSGLKIF